MIRLVVLFFLILVSSCSKPTVSSTKRTDEPVPAADARPPRLVVQTGHSSSIMDCRFNSTEEYIATSASDGIKILELRSLKEIRSIRCPVGEPRSIDFHPRSPLLIAAATGEKKLLIFDGDSESVYKEFDTSEKQVFVSFDSDGSRLVSVGEDYYGRYVSFIDSSMGKVLRKIPWNVSSVDCVRTSTGRKKLIAIGVGKISKSAELAMWDMQSMTLEKSAAVGNLTGVDLNSDGSIVSAGLDGNFVTLANSNVTERSKRHTNSCKIIATRFVASTDSVLAVCSCGRIDSYDSHSWARKSTGTVSACSIATFSPSGAFLFAGGAELIDLPNLQETSRKASSVSSWVSSRLSFSADGKRIHLVNNGYPVTWALAARRSFTRMMVPVLACDVSHSEKLYAYVHSADGNKDKWLLSVHDVEKNSVVVDVEVPIDPYSDIDVRFSEDDSSVSCFQGTRKIVVEVASGKITQEIKLALNIHEMLFREYSLISPDGKHITMIEARHPEKLHIIDARTGKLVNTFDGGTHKDEFGVEFGNYFDALGFSPDSKSITARTSKKIWIAEITDTKIFPSFFSYEGSPGTCVALGASFVASGFENGVVAIYERNSGKPVHRLAAHHGSVRTTVFGPDEKVLATLGNDNVVRLWDVSAGKELVAMILVGDDDWVVTVPDGRFDGTDDGMKRIHFVQGKQPIPLDSFFERFYTPGLLSQAVEGKLPELKPEVASIQKGFKLPPSVRIVAPTSGEEFGSESLEVTVEANDQGGGVDEIRLQLNGKTVAGGERGIAVVPVSGAAVRRTFKVVLSPGGNTLSATAFSADRVESAPVSVAVRCKGPSVESELFLVVVGVNKYRNSQFALKFCVSDANEFLSAVENGAKNIYRKVNKILLVDADVTRESIIAAFDSVSVRARTSDTFIFFFAGHGVMSVGKDPDFCLLPHDVIRIGDEALLERRGISAREMNHMSTRIQAGKQIIIFDACQSGAAIQAFSTRGLAEQNAIRQLARAAGIYVMAASRSSQSALEASGLGHGVFTYCIMKGLSGEADGGKKPDGKVTVNELIAYLDDNVPALTREYLGEEQIPQIGTRKESSDFPIVVVK